MREESLLRKLPVSLGQRRLKLAEERREKREKEERKEKESGSSNQVQRLSVGDKRCSSEDSNVPFWTGNADGFKEE